MALHSGSAIVLGVALAAAAAAEDWPTCLHDNQRSGVTAEQVAPPLALRWQFRSPFPPAAGWAPDVNGYGVRKTRHNVSHDDAFRVIAVGDAAYFCSSAEDCLYALDAASGRILWAFYMGAAPRLAPAFWKGRLFFGADDGVFRCVEAATGRLVWQVNAALSTQQMLGNGRFSSLWPIRAGGIVEDGVAWFAAGLFPANHLFLYAVRAEDGTVLWRRQLDVGGRADHVPEGHIVATADSLFTPARTEPARWSKADGSPIAFATPLPDVRNAHEYRFYNGGSEVQAWGGRQLVYGAACLLGYDPDAPGNDPYGRPTRGKLAFNWFNGRQAALKAGVAYVATDYHVLAVPQARLAEMSAGECREFEETYKRLGIASRLDHMAEYERRLIEHGADEFRVRFLAGGPLKWSRESWERWPAASEALFAKMRRKCAWMTPLCATESLILSGSILYAGGETALHALDTATGRPLWSFDTASRVRGLAAANGRLFVSTVDGVVRCFAPGPGGGEPAIVRPDGEPAKTDSEAARALLEQAGVTRGYCLVVGEGSDRLAEELARASELAVVCRMGKAESVDPARRRLGQAGLHGGRVTVARLEPGPLPFASYLFNVVVEASQAAMVPRDELLRVTKPFGGTAFLNGAPPNLDAWGAEARREGPWTVVRRGPLPASRDWTHNYASPANTYSSEDPLVRGPFGVLWYGEPGPRQRIDRHAGPPLPLVVGGRLFTIGYEQLMAYDVYNGLLLWRREIEGATRERLPLNTSNLAADDSSLFLVAGGRRCLRLDSRTGGLLRTYEPPLGGSAWAWLARGANLLYGSRAETDERGRPSEQTSNAVFALDVDTGRPAWTHEARGVDHDGIALAGGRVFLVSRVLTEAERAEALAGTVVDRSVPDRAAVDRKGQPIGPDLRKIAALDAQTGQRVWERPFNCTDITIDDAVVSAGRVGVLCMVKDGVLVVAGTGSLGHPHKEFLGGQFARRALYAFDAATGELLWGGRKGYRKRPIIVGDHVYAEPFAWDLRTGRQRMVPNPLSGREQPLDFHRGYIGCGHLLASAGTLFGARQGIAYWNLDEQAGFVPFAGMALACGLCAVPANGVFAAPEGRAGCACATPILTSVALYPTADGMAWGSGFSGGRTQTLPLPVKHLAVNLGAPGYRQDARGNLWIPYPARVEAGPLGKWMPTYQHDQAMCVCDETLSISGTDVPWVYSSAYAHQKPLRFRMLEEGQAPARYTVVLHFAEPQDARPGERVFSVRLQGSDVLLRFDIAAEAGGARRAVVKEFRGIEVRDYLEVALSVADGSKLRQPILCGLQAVREAE